MCLIYTSSAPCDVDMLALHHPFGFLCFFASLHPCLHLHTWVYVSSIFQSNEIMDTQSKPTFFLLGHLLLFDNILRSPLYVFHMLVFPYLASFLSLSLSCFSFYLFLFFFANLFLFSLHGQTWSEDTSSKGAISQAREKRARMQAKGCVPTKGNDQ